MKFKGEEGEELVREALSPSDAKKLGRGMKMRRTDWQEAKDEIMYQACLAKFQQNIDAQKVDMIEDGKIEEDFLMRYSFEIV